MSTDRPLRQSLPLMKKPTRTDFFFFRRLMRAPTEKLTIMLTVSQDEDYDYDKLSSEIWDLVEKGGNV